MKKLLLALFLIPTLFFSCKPKTKPDTTLAEIDKRNRADSVKFKRDMDLIVEKSEKAQFIIKMYYPLRKLGYSDKGAWHYIDSINTEMHHGTLPDWYAEVKFRTDSLIKIKD